MIRVLLTCMFVAFVAACSTSVGTPPDDGGDDAPPELDFVRTWRGKAHAGRVTHVAVQPDGTLLASADGAPRVAIHDAAVLEPDETHRFVNHPGDNVVAWSPDGTKLAAGGYNGVKVWDVDSGDLVGEYAHETDASADALAWSPDGEYLAAGRRPGGGGPGEIGFTIWDTSTGTPAASFDTCNWVTALGWSDDGAFLAAGASSSGRCSTGSLTVVDTTPMEVLARHGGSVAGYAVPWHPTQQAFYLLSGDRVRSLEPKADAQPTEVMSSVGARALALHPSTHDIALGMANGEVRIHGQGQAAGTLVTRHAKRVTDLAWHDGGDALISASTSGEVARTDLATGTETREYLGEGRSYAAAWSPDDRLLATGGEDGAIRIWNADSGELIREDYAHEHGVAALDWHPTRPLLASHGNDQARIWDAGDLSMRAELPHPQYYSDTEAAWSPGGSRLLLAGGTNRVDVWNPEADSVEVTYPYRSTAAAWSPDGSQAVLGSWWAGGDTYEPATVVGLEESTPRSLPSERDMQEIAIAWGERGIVRGQSAGATVLDPVTHLERAHVPFGNDTTLITSLAWSHDDRFLAVGGDYASRQDAFVVVWDAETDVTMSVLDRDDLANTVGEVRWGHTGHTLAATDWSGNVVVGRLDVSPPARRGAAPMGGKLR